jgi:hypothetical protein
MPRIIDVVEVPDQGANDLVSRVPEVGSGDFRLGGSQVIVRESQNAIFYRDGKSLDTFGPGRHTITTANLPLISSVMSFSRADDVFTAEVFFVNLRGVHRSEVGDPAADQPPRTASWGLLGCAALASTQSRSPNPNGLSAQIVGTQGCFGPARSKIICATPSSAP